MRWLSIIVTLFSLCLSLGAEASQCYCTADPYSKTYDAKEGIVKTWYGGKRAWSCIYTCTTPQGEAKITARHKKTYIGKDDGRWGICDGLVYEERYNNYIMDFVYTLEGNKGLDPIKSTSPDLVNFANQYCK